MVAKAVEALCKELGEIGSDEVVAAKLKSTILKEFAEQVSDEVLRRAGMAGSEMGELNRLITIDGDPPFEDAVPDDDNYLGCIWLHDVPSALNQRHDGADFPQELVCVTGGVQLWIRSRNRDTDKKLNKVMSYEEAARFLIFWLAEKILQIIRKNKWDRVEQLPDLFDQLAGLFQSKQPRDEVDTIIDNAITQIDSAMATVTQHAGTVDWGKEILTSLDAARFSIGRL